MQCQMAHVGGRVIPNEKSPTWVQLWVGQISRMNSTRAFSMFGKIHELGVWVRCYYRFMNSILFYLFFGHADMNTQFSLMAGSEHEPSKQLGIWNW